MRMALIGATLVASVLTRTVVFAAGPSLPAQPAKPMGCPPEYGVGVDGGIGTVGMATSATSYWLTGPGTISYSLSNSTTVGATISGNLSTDISIFVVDVTAQAGVAQTQQGRLSWRRRSAARPTGSTLNLRAL